MKGLPTGFWSKLLQDEDKRVLAWHPLADHAADVAAVTEGLLTRTLLGKRLAVLGGLARLTRVQTARFCVLAALHDIGKANIGFQNQRLPMRQRPFSAGHLGEVLALFNANLPGAAPLFSRLMTSLDVEALAAWGPNVFDLLVATISHHGRPVEIGVASKLDLRHWQPLGALDPFEEIAALVARTKLWFPEAWQPGGDPIPTRTVVQHAWSGLVNLADWLGSDDAQDRFPFRADGDTSDRIAFARRRARRVLRQIGLESWPAREALGTAPPTFKTIVQDKEPWAAQRAMLEIPIDEQGGVTVLEAETGSGKTEAALLRFVRLFHAGLVDGMVFALPTRTAATQIHARVREAMTVAFPEPATRPPVVLAVPGYLKVDDAYGTRLPRFQVKWDDAEHRHRGWAAEQPKRFLAGPVVVGTVDQVLLSTLQVRHAHLRAAALLRQFLVVDEVHASDAYMTRLLSTVLDQHRAAGGHALLLSATLGTTARLGLLAESRRERAAAKRTDFEDAVRSAYPASSHRPVGDPIAFHGILGDRPEKQVSPSLDPWMNEPEQVARTALDAARQGAKVLVIRNTVADCLATQEALEALADGDPVLFRCEGRIAPHHGRFADLDRKCLDLTIEARFGKCRDVGGAVVIATQTVEQSLDLDADLLITDLCPMDVLLQRVGRLHRHQRGDRPRGFAQARVIVLVPTIPLERWVVGDTEEDSHGLGTVYWDLRVLEATWQVLRGAACLRIPAQNRELVEICTHPGRLEALARVLGDAWENHAQTVQGRLLGEAQQANFNAIQRDKAFTERDCLFPEHGERKIPTRLGLDDRRVRFEPSVESPFGQELTDLSIPGFLAEGVDPEIEMASNVHPKAGIVTFSFGTLSYRYGRLGLQKE